MVSAIRTRRPSSGIGPAPEKAEGFETIDKLDRAVMAQQEPLRQFLHRHLVASGIAFDGQQGLMLLRCQPGLAGSGLTEIEEFAQGMAKFRQGLVIGLGDPTR